MISILKQLRAMYIHLICRNLIAIFLNKLILFYNRNQLSKIIKPLISGRDMLLANTLSVYNDINDDSNIWFGIGFSNTEKVNNTNIARLIEIDICDLYFHFGILGLLVSLYPILFIGYLIFTNFKKLYKLGIRSPLTYPLIDPPDIFAS